MFGPWLIYRSDPKTDRFGNGFVRVLVINSNQSAFLRVANRIGDIKHADTLHRLKDALTILPLYSLETGCQLDITVEVTLYPSVTYLLLPTFIALTGTATPYILEQEAIEAGEIEGPLPAPIDSYGQALALTYMWDMLNAS